MKYPQVKDRIPAMPIIDTLCRPEDQLQVSERLILSHLKEALQLVAHPVSLILHDLVPGKGATMVFVNSVFEEFTGYSSAELLGHNSVMLRGVGTDFANLRDVQQSMLDSGKPIESLVVFYKKNGEACLVKIIGRPVLSGLGIPCFWVLTHENVTAPLLAEKGKLLNEHISVFFSKGNSLRVACQESLDFIIEEFDFLAGAVWLLSEDREQMRLFLDCGLYALENKNGTKRQESIVYGEGLLGEVWKKGEMCEWGVDSLGNDADCNIDKDNSRPSRMYALPLILDGEIQGMLVLTAVGDSFQRIMLRETLDIIATAISSKIQKSKLGLKYDNLFNHTSHPIIVLSHDLVVRTVNPAFARHVKKESSMLLGCSFLDFISSDKRDEVCATLYEMKEGDDDETHVWDIRVFEDQFLSISWNVSLISGSKDFLLVGEDLTSLSKALDSLKAFKEQNKDQHQQLRDIAWAQSHKVRAPLANIMGLVQLLSSSTSLAEKDSELLQLLQSASMNLDIVVREISANANLLEVQSVVQNLLS